jgi:hypothetical protein
MGSLVMMIMFMFIFLMVGGLGSRCLLMMGSRLLWSQFGRQREQIAVDLVL